MKKATSAEFQQRVKIIQALMLQGRSRSAILQYAAEKWGTSERQADEYAARAREIINEINTISLQDNMAMILANYWDQYRKANAKKNGFLCVTILEKIAKLKGLDQQTINIITDDNRPLAGLTDEDLDSKLESLQ